MFEGQRLAILVMFLCFMKIERTSFSLQGSKQPNKILLVMFFLCYVICIVYWTYRNSIGYILGQNIPYVSLPLFVTCPLGTQLLLTQVQYSQSLSYPLRVHPGPVMVMFSSCMHSKMRTQPVSSLLRTKYMLVRVIGDILSAKSDVNGLKKNICFQAILNWKVTKLQKKVFQKPIYIKVHFAR